MNYFCTVVVTFLNLLYNKPSWFHYDHPRGLCTVDYLYVASNSQNLARCSTLKTLNSNSDSKVLLKVKAF